MPQTVATPSDAAPTAAVRAAIRARLRPPVARLTGLDGLRAIAVLAVLAYHAGLGVAQGGFLGVEVFFVISGYLITALLLAEHRRSGRIDTVRFWLRRARRLLPALFLLLGATLALRPGRASRRGCPAADGCPRRVRLRHQLAPDRRRSIVLRDDRTAVAVHAPLVAGHRGAVLPALAAGPRRAPGGRAARPAWR